MFAAETELKKLNSTAPILNQRNSFASRKTLGLPRGIRNAAGNPDGEMEKAKFDLRFFSHALICIRA